MAGFLDPKLREQLSARLDYYREMGIYDFYRRPPSAVLTAIAESERGMNAQESAKMISVSKVGEEVFASQTSPLGTAQPSAPRKNVATELKLIREDLGDCTRCVLHKQGRKQIVFGVGDPNADLMFIGEAPGADEDQQGIPFVGRAGQLLTNMILAMGLKREDVYIANIIKCRPPGNRTPERDECETCSPFLMRQIAAICPKVIVALGAVAAKTLLAINAPMAELRGRWYDFNPRVESNGRPNSAPPPVKLAVTYHPAFLLRDPRQKKETWKDLQMVMKYLGLTPPAKVQDPA